MDVLRAYAAAFDDMTRDRSAAAEATVARPARSSLKIIIIVFNTVVAEAGCDHCDGVCEESDLARLLQRDTRE